MALMRLLNRIHGIQITSGDRRESRAEKTSKRSFYPIFLPASYARQATKVTSANMANTILPQLSSAQVDATKLTEKNSNHFPQPNIRQ